MLREYTESTDMKPDVNLPSAKMFNGFDGGAPSGPPPQLSIGPGSQLHRGNSVLGGALSQGQ